MTDDPMGDVTLTEALDALEALVRDTSSRPARADATRLLGRAGRAVERPSQPAAGGLAARLRHHADEIEALGRDMDWPEHDGGWDCMHVLRTAADLFDAQPAAEQQIDTPPKEP